MQSAEKDWDELDGDVRSAFGAQIFSTLYFTALTVKIGLIRSVMASPQHHKRFASPVHGVSAPKTPARGQPPASDGDSVVSPSTSAFNTPTRKRTYAPAPASTFKPATAVAQSPALVSGARFKMPVPETAAPPTPSIPPPEQPSRAYVLYDGHDHVDGVFTAYHTTEDEEGLDQHVRGYGPAVFKGFSNLETAQNHYREAKSTGVIQLLKQSIQEDDVYIVVKGVKPGVYLRRRVCFPSLTLALLMSTLVGR